MSKIVEFKRKYSPETVLSEVMALGAEIQSVAIAVHLKDGTTEVRWSQMSPMELAFASKMMELETDDLIERNREI